MGNILVLGVGPLPVEASDKLHAPGLRTWQLAEVLAKDKHFVTIGTIEFGDFDGKNRPAAVASQREELGTRISRVHFKYHPDLTVQALATLHVATRFSCIVSTTDIMNALSADLDANVPRWMDYNGEPFAEKQLQAAVHHHDGSLPRQWELYFKGLKTADQFSVCSEPQRCATIGQLAFAGRLTGQSDGFQFVHVMPNSSRAVAARPPSRNFTMKGHKIPAKSIMALWTGGFNTWSDPDTLFHGVAAAMEANPDLYFVMTGGAIEGHDSESFRQFEQLVQASPLVDRFVFLGWRPLEDVVSLFQQADLAILAEKNCVEGELGARTRLMEWIQFGLPIIASPVCETARVLARNKLIYAYPAENPAALCLALADVAQDLDAARERAARAKTWFENDMSEAKVFQPLLQWANQPCFAPDRLTDEQKQSKLTQLLSPGKGTGRAVQIHTESKKPGLLSRLFSKGK